MSGGKKSLKSCAKTSPGLGPGSEIQLLKAVFRHIVAITAWSLHPETPAHQGLNLVLEKRLTEVV